MKLPALAGAGTRRVEPDLAVAWLDAPSEELSGDGAALSDCSMAFARRCRVSGVVPYARAARARLS
jgi:hypothetical protein